jgi:hypothetical protein
MFRWNRNPGRRPGVFVISAPKTASNFVRLVLCRILDLDPIDIRQTDAATRRRVTDEADLAQAARIRAKSKPGIAHVHLLPNPNTLLFLERSALRAVIVWRAIEDCVVSLREEWQQQWSTEFDQVAADGYSLQFLGIVPWAFVRTFLQASEEEQHDLVIDLAVSWYCRFTSGWRSVEKSRKLPVASIDYEALASDELNTIQNLLRQLDTSVPDSIVREHIAGVKSHRLAANTNVGHPGRGHALLTDGQKARIRQIMVPFGIADTGREDPPAPIRFPSAIAATAIRLATRTLWNADNDIRVGHADAAIAGYERVLKILTQGPAADAKSQDGLQCAFQALYGLADAYERLGGTGAKREATLRSALNVLDQLRALNPTDAAFPVLAARISLAVGQTPSPKEKGCDSPTSPPDSAENSIRATFR